jgi:hypothetical protein
MSIFGTPVKDFSGNRFATSLQSGSLNVATGSLIIVCAGWSDGGTCSFSDLTGNSYTSTTRRNDSTTGFQQFGYCLSAAADAANKVTATFSFGGGNNYETMAVYVVPLSGSASFDLDADNSGTSDSTTATFSTTGTDEFVVAFALDGFGTGGYVAGSGYTLDSASYGTFSGAEHRTFSSTQSGITASFSSHPTSSFAIAIAFKGPGGGGGGSRKSVVCIMQ